MYDIVLRDYRDPEYVRDVCCHQNNKICALIKDILNNYFFKVNVEW